jgi:hypothetical protein
VVESEAVWAVARDGGAAVATPGDSLLRAVELC